MAFRLGERGLWLPGRQIKPVGTPRINWSHPLTKDLICYFYDTGDDIVDLVRHWPRTFTGTPAANGDVSPYGAGMRWLGTNDSSVWFNTSNRDPRLRTLGTRGFTAACSVFQNVDTAVNSVGSATEAGVFGRVHANGNAGADSMFWWAFIYYRIAAGVGEYAMLFRDSTAGLAFWVAPYNAASFTGSSTLNNFHVLTVTINGVGDTGNAYADGYFVGTNEMDYIAHDGGDTTDHIVFGNKSTSTQSNNSDIPYPGGFIYWGACWDRELTFTEHALLYNDPYCFLLPANEPLVIMTYIPPTPLPAAVDLAVVNAISIGVPVLGLEKVLFADGIVIPSPTIGLGSFINAMTLPVGKTVAPPTLGAPVLAKTIGVSSLTAGPPVIGTPTFAERNEFIASSLVAGQPVLQAPVSHQSGDTFASDFVHSPPIIAAGVLGQNHVLAATGFSVSMPTIELPIIAQSILVISLTTSPPTIAPSSLTRMFIIPAEDLVVGHPTFFEPEAEETGPPRAWFPCREERWSHDPDDKWFDEDHDQNEKPVKQAIFTNLNDELEISISHLTLAGRTSPERGPAEAIEPSSPLYLFDHRLWIDWTEVEQLRADLDAEVIARDAAITAEANARIALDARVLLLRQVVTAPTTFYVSTAGNDINDGNVGSPWRTVQHAARRISYLDIRADVTVQIADGSYDESVIFYPAIGGNGAFVYFIGNITTPANVILRSIAIYQGSVLPYVFEGIRLVPTVSGHLVNVNGAQVYLGRLEYAAAIGAYAHIRGGSNTVINFEWPYKITGGGSHHLLGTQGAKFYYYGSPVTITGTPTFSQAFAWAEDGGTMLFTSGTSFSGGVNAATKKYRAQVGAVIQTFGSGVNYFPGGVAGDLLTGGQYL